MLWWSGGHILASCKAHQGLVPVLTGVWGKMHFFSWSTVCILVVGDSGVLIRVLTHTLLLCIEIAPPCLGIPDSISIKIMHDKCGWQRLNLDHILVRQMLLPLDYTGVVFSFLCKSYFVVFTGSTQQHLSITPNGAQGTTYCWELNWGSSMQKMLQSTGLLLQFLLLLFGGGVNIQSLHFGAKPSLLKCPVFVKKAFRYKIESLWKFYLLGIRWLVHKLWKHPHLPGFWDHMKTSFQKF